MKHTSPAIIALSIPLRFTLKPFSYITSDTLSSIETKKSFKQFNKFDQLNQSNRAKGL